MVTQLLGFISLMALFFWVMAFAERASCKRYDNDFNFDPYD